MAAGAIALVALSWVVVSKLGRPGAPPLPHSPLDALPPGTAAAHASELARSERYVESLPYFRRAAAEAPGAWRAHVDYATALLDAVHQGRRHLGLDEFAVRGSPERVAMVREALDHLIEAERLASAAGDRAGVAWSRRTRGQVMAAWGLPWDAFVAYRQAEWTDSTMSEIAGIADRIMGTMEQPTRKAGGEPSP